jgi:hypothetical protein
MYGSVSAGGALAKNCDTAKKGRYPLAGVAGNTITGIDQVTAPL